jgi:hypothetical protein
MMLMVGKGRRRDDWKGEIMRCKQGQREIEGEYHMGVRKEPGGLVHVATSKCLYSLRLNLMLSSPFLPP